MWLPIHIVLKLSSKPTLCFTLDRCLNKTFHDTYFSTRGHGFLLPRQTLKFRLKINFHDGTSVFQIKKKSLLSKMAIITVAIYRNWHDNVQHYMNLVIYMHHLFMTIYGMSDYANACLNRVPIRIYLFQNKKTPFKIFTLTRPERVRYVYITNSSLKHAIPFYPY